MNTLLSTKNPVRVAVMFISVIMLHSTLVLATVASVVFDNDPLDQVRAMCRERRYSDTLALIAKQITAYPEAYHVQARCYLSMDDPDGAIEGFRKMLAIRPWDLSALDSITRIVIEKDDVSPALDNLRKSIDLDPTSVERQILFGILSVIKQDYRSAGFAFSEVLPIMTQEVILKLQDKNKLLSIGIAPNAAEYVSQWFNEFFDIWKRADDARRHLLDLYKLDRTDEQITATEEYIGLLAEITGRSGWQVAIGLDVLGERLRRNGRLSEAETAFRQALSIRRQEFHPSHVTLVFSLHKIGNLMGRTGDFNEAEQLYREALDLNRRYRRFSRGALYSSVIFKGAHFSKLTKTLYIQDAPTVVNSLNKLGFLLFRTGRINEAESVYREALALNQDDKSHRDFAAAQSDLGLNLILAVTKRLPELITRLVDRYNGDRKMIARELMAISNQSLVNDPEMIAELQNTSDQYQN